MWHCPLRNPATCLTSPPRCPLGIWNFTLSKQNYWLPTPKIQLLSQMLSLLSVSFQEVPHTQAPTCCQALYTPLLLVSLSPSFSLCLAALAFFSLLEGFIFVLVLSHQTAAPATAPPFLSFKPQFKWNLRETFSDHSTKGASQSLWNKSCYF